MRKAFLVLLILFAGPFAAMAQPEYPPAEVFGGYSYFRANPEGFNLNGWNASVAGNITNWFGVEGDFSGQYGHMKDEFGSIPDININHYTIVGGPKLSYRAGSITPFAHFLIGAARAGTHDDFLHETTSDWALATIVGAGVDIDVSRSVAIRVAQADWVMTRFETGRRHDERQNNFRFSAGIVLKLGSR